MAKVIQAPSFDDTLITAIVQEYSVGTKIVAPKNCFGQVNQYGKNKIFADSITLDKKSISWLSTPKIPFFGKIKEVVCYFLPYGFSGTLYFNEEFTLKNGRKAKMDLKIQYEVQVEDAQKAEYIMWREFAKKSRPTTTCKMVTFQEWKNAVSQQIKDHLICSQADGAHWTFELKPGGRLAGLSFASIGTETSMKLFLQSMFKKIGYKPNKLVVDITNINYV
ncbi:MAG: hypothetical protein IJW58_04680 [Clostridia bacterium]|nr:hypothetical protein [Clostridia bacterium]